MVKQTKIKFADKCSDKVAQFGGSWAFIIYAIMFLSVWMTYNLYCSKPFDPAPFIGLNLILSCVAAFQAPFVLMSNNRQSKIDRERDIKDFEIDKLTNEQVKLVHRKVDYLIEQIDSIKQ